MCRLVAMTARLLRRQDDVPPIVREDVCGMMFACEAVLCSVVLSWSGYVIWCLKDASFDRIQKFVHCSYAPEECFRNAFSCLAKTCREHFGACSLLVSRPTFLARTVGGSSAVFVYRREPSDCTVWSEWCSACVWYGVQI